MTTKGTKLHNIRIGEPLWSAALDKARRCGETISAVIRRKLNEYLAEPEPPTAEVKDETR